ncbi:MAG: hypothetical protein R3225_01645 [Halofilum sp. (in: g-proteobacteria)]|nr:hypothetical protein [Halofilum sp. (in: g-proteobacteria)]
MRGRAPCRLLLLGLLAVQPLLPVAGAAEPDSEPAPALDALDSYRLALLRIKGHVAVARTLLQLHADGADYHLGQPLRSIFETIQPELARRGAPLTADTLEQLERATAAGPDAALATLDLAAAAIDGSFAQTGAPDTRSALALAEALLREAVALYADAVEDHEVVDVRRYRAGRGYALQAEALVRHASGLRGHPEQARLVEAVVLVRQAWPGVDPPPIVFDPAGVAGRLEEVLAAMERLR